MNPRSPTSSPHNYLTITNLNVKELRDEVVFGVVLRDPDSPYNTGSVFDTHPTGEIMWAEELVQMLCSELESVRNVLQVSPTNNATTKQPPTPMGHTSTPFLTRVISHTLSHIRSAPGQVECSRGGQHSAASFRRKGRVGEQ